MEPEVRLAEIWLNNKGYFTMTNLKARGNKEIDLLGIHVSDKKQDDSCHVEVSSWSSGNLQGRKGEKFNSPTEVAKYFCELKFQHPMVLERVIELLGKEYRRTWIVNSFLQFEKKRDDIATALKDQYGIDLVSLREVIQDVIRNHGSGSRDPVLRTVELIGSVGS